MVNCQVFNFFLANLAVSFAVGAGLGPARPIVRAISDPNISRPLEKEASGDGLPSYMGLLAPSNTSTIMWQVDHKMFNKA